MSSWLPLAAYIRPDLSYDLGLQDDAGEKVEHCNDDDHKILDVYYLALVMITTAGIEDLRPRLGCVG